LGICYLQLSMFPFAKKNLETAIDIAPDNASAYYYYCLATIAGERIRFMSLDTIEEMLMYLNTAIGMEPSNQLYLLLMSMIKHDFYVLNSLSEKKPTYEELFAQLDVSQIEYEEIQRLKTCVKVSSFDKFGI
ncbi:MAG: hypothetical protein IJX43_02325, partial [Alphaproteobacteria bacterium]|nr:hypothetical protein [Alphaproteobacteria bacterium]